MITRQLLLICSVVAVVLLSFVIPKTRGDDVSLDIATSTSDNDAMPLPFKRQLSFGDTGNDVTIAQWLLQRAPCFPTDMTFNFSVYDHFTARIVGVYQLYHDQLPVTGRIDSLTASSLLKNYLHQDGYKPIFCSSGQQQQLPKGMKYLVDVPVHTDRTVETTATLYDSNCNVKLRFRARTKGQKDYNELTSDGSTPTGLYFFDLNSPEDDPKSYGPYNVNRATAGVKGNALVVVPDIRYGILLHTGEWDNWNTSKPMPNSHGCIHAWPQDIKTISDILTKQLKVAVRENPFGKKPYPFTPQGLLSVWNVDIAQQPAGKCENKHIQHLVEQIIRNR